MNMQQAKAKGEAGMRRSAEHAGSEWLQKAMIFLHGYWSFLHLVTNDPPFTMEQARAWCTAAGLPEPPELRAWGSVTQTAVRQKLIEPTGGYAPAKSSNGTKKPLYRAVRP